VKRRTTALVAAFVLALTVSGSALAFDCIRVSSSLQGLTQSTKSGNWLLFDISSASGVQQTFSNVFEASISPADATCLAETYAQSGQPAFFALGIGVAGPNGVLAHNNSNTDVLGNGKGIDHLENSGIVPALFAAAAVCNVTLPE
jgi:hypothetical protein